MADGYSMGAGDLFRSRILGTGMEDTPYNQGQIGQMLGGIQPEQLQAFFQNPQVQQQFKQFGVDPQQMLGGMRQSPFFSNQFMQGHPGLGGGLTHALANVAMTPKPDLVQGFGAGMTNTAQGLQGGNDMLRQFQLRQMMAPMGALGAQMPMFGEQRRRGIEEAIIAQEQRRPQEFQQAEELKRQIAEMQHQAQLQKGEPRFNPITGETWTNQPPMPQQPPQPQQGPWAGQFGMGPLMSPGAPAQPGGWTKEQAPLSRIAGVAGAKETPSTKKLKGAQAGRQDAEAGLAGAEADAIREGRTKSGGAGTKGSRANIDAKYDAMAQEVRKRIFTINQTETDPGKLKQAEQDAQQEWAAIERDRQNALQKLGLPNTNQPNPGISPNARPNPAGGGPPPNAPQATHTLNNRPIAPNPQGTGWIYTDTQEPVEAAAPTKSKKR